MGDLNKASSKMPVICKTIKAAQRDAFLKGLDQLLSLLRQHPQMPANPHDPGTPPPLFFTWDFIQRTRGNLAQISPEMLEANEDGHDRDAALEKYSDCVGRAIMAEIVVSDQTAVASLMRGGKMDFGYEVRKAAKKAAEAGGGEEGKRHPRL